MAKLQYNEIVKKAAVIMDGEPYVVLSSAIAKKDRQKASNNVKLKNLRTGNVVDRTFHQADTLEEAGLDKREIKYLYTKSGRPPADRQEYFFCEPDNPRERFSLSGDVIGEEARFMKENSIVEALVFDDAIIAVHVPIKVDLVVKEAAPAVKGNTSGGATKEVVLETGAVVQVPMFINQGDAVRINTETGLYTERVEKA